MNPYLQFGPHAQTFALVVIACAVSFCLGWQRAACRGASRAEGSDSAPFSKLRRWSNPAVLLGGSEPTSAPEPRYCGSIIEGGRERAFNIGATDAEDATRQLRTFYTGPIEIISIRRIES